MSDLVYAIEEQTKTLNYQDLLYLMKCMLNRLENVRQTEDDYFWSDKNQKVLNESLLQMNSGKHSIHELVEV